MTDFKELVQLRRSHRKFTSEEINADDLKNILRAVLCGHSVMVILGHKRCF